MTDWSTMRVLVTGGSRGIGLGIAQGFLQAGAAVAISGRSPDALEEATRRLGQHDGRVHGVLADVSDPQACVAMADEAQGKLGGLDVLCANAGIYPERTLDDMAADDVAAVLATNVAGTIFSVQACRAALKASGRGRVVVDGGQTLPELPAS